MAIATCPDEVPRCKIALLGNHVREERVLRDVENQTDGCVGAALIEQAREAACANMELEKGMAGSQRRAPRADVLLWADALIRENRWVPSCDDVTSRIRAGADLIDHVGDLINA